MVDINGYSWCYVVLFNFWYYAIIEYQFYFIVGPFWDGYFWQVFLCFTKFVLVNKLFWPNEMNQYRFHQCSISPTLGYLLVRSLAVGLATLVLTPPAFYSTLEDTFTIWSSCPIRKGLAVDWDYLAILWHDSSSSFVYFDMIQVPPTSTVHVTFSWMFK